ncbi:hybrid sensor histidine kinase/response regulator [Brevifollis gellanilyticus]|uniref:histidine kinase n=1 Tax=Brevifollis gellanilyticus TaxID=748831 RepID=A0A512MEB9_9BACT|nr:ATP-binding protein [Brevifollis gellanilyticus]GEP45083.1 hypothetical protein BGE01nite_43740 [Brevifollis gellanilyticus]
MRKHTNSAPPGVDRGKDEFLAMLAHELRNPLSALRNAAELLDGEHTTEGDHAQATHIIHRQIENMSRMLDGLLDVSRVTEGKIELRRAPVSLESVLTAALGLVRPACAAQHQILSLTLPKDPVYVNGDATRLEQIFGNILANACKYSGIGCSISVRAERAPDTEPPEVTITIQDDGVGIDPKLLPHIFDLFVQSTRPSHRSQGGLGIGLTLAQRLVKLHGGRIEAHSGGLGQGTTFTAHLPVLRLAPPGPVTKPHVHELPRRILIVDDNTDSARSLAMLQARRGHQTCTAFTGPEALTAAMTFKPEIILLDIGLPGMDGFEVAGRIRAMPEIGRPLIVGMSGYGSREDLARAAAAGFDDYFVKPIDLGALRKLLSDPFPSAARARFANFPITGGTEPLDLKSMVNGRHAGSVRHHSRD